MRYFRITLIVWCLLILFLSSQTGQQSYQTSLAVTDIIEGNNDRFVDHQLVRSFAHVSEYIILSMLVFMTFAYSKVRSIYVIPVAIIFALFDESFQHFIPGRVFDINDLKLDLLGILIGYYLAYLLYVHRKALKLIFFKK
jgi:VanZ family protein